MDDFHSVPKFDAHIHIYTDRDAFYDQAKKDNFKLWNIVVDVSDGMQAIRDDFRWCIAQQNRHPEEIYAFTAFDIQPWEEPDFVRNTLSWLDSCFDAGAYGFKVWKNIGMVHQLSDSSMLMIDDEGFDPIFEYVTDEGKVAIGHLGEPKNCWLPLDEMTTKNDSSYFANHPEYHMYLHPNLPSYQDQIDARDRMLDRNPNMTFVGAHMGSLEWSVDELAIRLDKYPNMSVDLAARMGQVFYQTRTHRDKVRNFFIEYQDQLLYGTDLGDDGDGDPDRLQQRMHEVWIRDWEFFVTDNTMTSNLIDGEFKGLKLPRDVVDRIYYANAAQLVEGR